MANRPDHFGKRPVSAHQQRPQPFFPVKSHAPVWRVLRSSIVQGEGVVRITGEAGAGKSHFLLRLQGILPENRDMVVLSEPDLEPKAFLAALTRAIAPVSFLPPEGGLCTWEDLLQALEHRAQEGRKLLVAVDKAHMIRIENAEAVEMVVGFSDHGVKPVQVVLLGRPDLIPLLEYPGFKSLGKRVTGAGEITPLTRSEVWDYIHFHLKETWGDFYRVSWFAWVEIYSRSHGNPEKINRILHQVVSQLKVRPQRSITRTLVRRVMDGNVQTPPGGRIRPLLTWGGGAMGLLLGLWLIASLFSGSSSEKVQSANETVNVSDGALKGVDGGNTFVPLQPTKVEPVPEKKATQPVVEGVTNPHPLFRPPQGASVRPPSRVWPPAQEKSPPREDQPVQSFPRPTVAPVIAPPQVRAAPPPLPHPVELARKAPVLPPEQPKDVHPTQSPQEHVVRPVQPPLVSPMSMVQHGGFLWPLPVPKPLSIIDRYALRESTQEKVGMEITTIMMETEKALSAGIYSKEPQSKAPLHHAQASVPPAAQEDLKKITTSAPVTVKGWVNKPETKAEASHGASPAVSSDTKHITLASEATLRAAGQLFVVQTGSFLNRENAERLVVKLGEKGLEPYVHLFVKEDKRWYSVRINYKNLQSAEQTANMVKKEVGLPTQVIDLFYE